MCLTPGVAQASPAAPVDRIVFAQAPPGSSSDDGGLAAGGRVVVLDLAAPAPAPVDLAPGFQAAGRPDLSFDGRHVLFVGRRTAAEPPAVWEVAVDGSDLHRIVERSGITQAIYLSSIYALDDEQPARQIAFTVAADDGRDAPALFTARRDGSHARQVTFSPAGAGDPFLLSDSRLLYAGGLPGGRGTALFTINADGTDVAVFAAAHEEPAFRRMPCETDDDRVVYVESSSGGPFAGGSLVAVARTRSLHTRRVIAPATDGVYHSPSAAGDGRLLVSYRPRDGGTYGIRVLDLRDGARVETLYDSDAWDEVDAVWVRPRVEPPGRSSVVDDRATEGQLYCLNAYRTDLEPPGEAARETIEALRVVRADTSDAEGTALGEVPVHPDGSFFLKIPARTPLRLVTLGRDGRVLRSMTSWFWVMPGERRGCIGCHEDRELTPPNRYVLALTEEPVPVGVEDGPELAPSHPLAEAPGPRR